MSILKTKPKHHLEIGGGAFIADFYVDEKNPDVKHNYLHIYAPNGVFEQKVVGYPFGYLLAAISQGKEDEVNSYCVMLWRITQEIYQDLGFAQDIIKAINKRDKRLMKQAEKAASEISKHQEQADQVFMESVVERASMSKKEAKKASEADKAEMRAVLNEDKEAENGDTTDN